MQTKFKDFNELVSNYLIGQRVVVATTSMGLPVYRSVQGYLFDGYYWYPAYDDWDGWQPFPNNEI